MSDDLFNFNAPRHPYDLKNEDGREAYNDEYFFEKKKKSVEIQSDLMKNEGREAYDDAHFFDCAASPHVSQRTSKLYRKTPRKSKRAGDEESEKYEEVENEDIENVSPTKKQKTEKQEHTPPKRNSSMNRSSLTNKSIQEITKGYPKRQSPRLVEIAKAIRRTNASTKQRRRSQSADSIFAPTRSSIAKAKQSKKVQKISGFKNAGLSEQDQNELEKIVSFKKPLAKSNSQRPSITRPKEFNFSTNSRVRSKSVHNDEGEVDFTKSLRTSTATNTGAPKGITKVQPFNLSESHRRNKEPANEFVSMAELDQQFFNKTPKRFMTKPSEPEPYKQGTGITMPQTPKLSTTSRTRSHHIPTREEIEEKELEEALKHKFKAKPLNKKVFEAPSLDVSVEKKPTTKPEPFNITRSKKAEMMASQNNLMNMSKFSSTSSIASSTSGKWEKHPTAVKPFSFDKRDQNADQKKQQRIQKALEEEKKLAEFHANPMPIFEAGITGLPPKKPPPKTKVQAFNLQADERGAAKKEAMERERQLQEQEEKNRRRFHAQPDDIVHKKPFIPEKSTKPLTDISGFTLNTEKRSDERAKFDMHVMEKEAEIKRQKLEEEERKLKEEEAAVAEMRKNAVHKAQPVRNYKPVEIKHSEKPATVPQTPKFATSARLRSRAESNLSLNSLDTTISR